MEGGMEMSKMQIFNHPRFGEVEIIDIDGSPHFGATKTASSLGYSNPHDAIARHCRVDGVVKHEVIDSMGRTQEMNFITEGNLYRLITKSKLPDSEKYESWVFDEVLPTIRKTGSYSVQQFQLPQSMPEALRLLAAEMEDKQRIAIENDRLALQTAEQQAQLRSQEAPVAIYNLAISAHNTMSMQEVSKSLGTGRTRLYEILREEGIVMKGSTMPYQRYLDSGHFKVTERPRASGDTIINDPATRVTAKGFDFIARMMQKRAESIGQTL